MTELSETVDCRVTFLNKHFSDRILVPIPRDEIIQTVEGGGTKESPLRHVERSQECFIGNYGNNFRLVNIAPGNEVKIDFKVPFVPSPPPRFTSLLIHCLSNDERYTKWKSGGRIWKIIADEFKGKAKEQITDSEAAHAFGSFIKQKLGYSRERTKYEFIDEMLVDPSHISPLQDCLGYHALLVGCLRSFGIPATVDVGIRLTNQDDPHAWAWYFDRQIHQWQAVDLNDEIRNDSQDFAKNGRVSMTLGTTHKILDLPDFPDTVASFVQYGLSKNLVNGSGSERTSAKFATFSALE